MDRAVKIVDELMGRIRSGEFAPGEKLPSENRLADQYQVPRYTVRDALNHLEERGLIFSEQGRGRFLQQEAAPIRMTLSSKSSFTEKMEKLGRNLVTENISCSRVDYDKDIFTALDAGEGDAVYRIGRLRSIDGEPIAIHYSYVTESRFPDIAEDGPSIGSMFAYYRERGHFRFASTTSLLSVSFPSMEEQKLLSCNRLVPLILVESECMDAESGEILEYTRILYRSDRFKYDISEEH